MNTKIYAVRQIAYLYSDDGDISLYKNTFKKSKS